MCELLTEYNSHTTRPGCVRKPGIGVDLTAVGVHIFHLPCLCFDADAAHAKTTSPSGGRRQYQVVAVHVPALTIDGVHAATNPRRLTIGRANFYRPPCLREIRVDEVDSEVSESVRMNIDPQWIVCCEPKRAGVLGIFNGTLITADGLAVQDLPGSFQAHVFGDKQQASDAFIEGIADDAEPDWIDGPPYHVRGM